MKKLIVAIVLVVSGLLLRSCGEAGTTEADYGSPETLAAILAEDYGSSNPYDAHLDSAPDDGCVRLRAALAIGPLRRAFNDSNHIQLEAARALGIKPIETDADILRQRRGVVRIASCKEYYLDTLTHSYAYLVPEASDLLREIGRRFNDSLQGRGGGAYRMKVTSVLRTPATVRKLRRVNRNATEESTHMYGTTFDISYAKFVCDDAGAPHRTFEDLKNLLAQILYDLRREGRCYVKFEFRQACFHITTRPIEK